MILYSPINGEVLTDIFKYMPRHCFLMTQLGGEISPRTIEIRNSLSEELKKYKIELIDANAQTTGGDFLDKIWKQILGVPIGIAILTREMSQTTVANIYYELGLFDSLGKETIVIKTEDFDIPSDSIRTEYIKYNYIFNEKLREFINNVFERKVHYTDMADILSNDPILSFDYIRRAYLISGEQSLKNKAEDIFKSNKNSFNDHDAKFARGFLISK